MENYRLKINADNGVKTRVSLVLLLVFIIFPSIIASIAMVVIGALDGMSVLLIAGICAFIITMIFFNLVVKAIKGIVKGKYSTYLKMNDGRVLTYDGAPFAIKSIESQEPVSKLEIDGNVILSLSGSEDLSNKTFEYEGKKYTFSNREIRTGFWAPSVYYNLTVETIAEKKQMLGL